MRRTSARPIPPVAPVTTATRPGLSFKSLFSNDLHTSLTATPVVAPDTRQTG
ncbi:hypothetical protein SXCC_00879 [Gluconacetobacter sp. SXCC-1]|nr:hypothetical protein SXCC_00879 [Gluconacetobacter sp. SXCC-1]